MTCQCNRAHDRPEARGLRASPTKESTMNQIVAVAKQVWANPATRNSVAYVLRQAAAYLEGG